MMIIHDILDSVHQIFFFFELQFDFVNFHYSFLHRLKISLFYTDFSSSADQQIEL